MVALPQVLVPCCGMSAILTLMDHNVATSDEEVGSIKISFDDVLGGKVPKIAWHHIYGLGEAASSKV